MKHFALIMGLCCLSASVAAQEYPSYNENQPLQEYFDASDTNANKSIIYVFFNNEPCESCADAVELVEQVYNENFADQYNMYLINYQNDQENDFIDTYNLNRPLEVVLQRIDDGAAFAYQKLDNLPDMVSDPTSFEEYLTEEINSFLGSE